MPGQLIRRLSSAIHEPHKHLKISEFKATGYPKPIVDHAKARKKAIARFKK